MNRRVWSVAGRLAGGIALVAAVLGVWFSGAAWGAHHRVSQPWVGVLTLSGAAMFLGFTLAIHRMDQLNRSLDDSERERAADHEALTNFVGKQLGDMTDLIRPLSEYVAEVVTQTRERSRPTSITHAGRGD